MKYLLFCTISLLSLAACIREDVPSADGFALAEGDPLPEFSISNPYGTVSKKDLENPDHFFQYDLLRLPESFSRYIRFI